MKKSLFVLFLAVNAFAADSKPLITKSSGGGFMMPEYAGFERCEVYADRVELTGGYGFSVPTALQTQETRQFKITGDIALVIKKATEEQVTEKPNSLCDGPSTGIYAHLDGQEVLLYSTGGCGSPEKSRNGGNSNKLKQIVNQFCPKTYQFSDPS